MERVTCSLREASCCSILDVAMICFEKAFVVWELNSSWVSPFWSDADCRASMEAISVIVHVSCCVSFIKDLSAFLKT